MQKFNIPEKITTLIFDIDGTLYTSKEFVEEQIDAQIRHWAQIEGISAEEGRKKISEFRKKFAEKNGGKQISLGNAFTHFGIDIDTSIRWRNELLHPENYLEKNPELAKMLEAASRKFKLIALTNNPETAARKTLSVIGINELFSTVIGLDTCRKSKPDQKMIDLAAEISGSAKENCVSIGDRYDIDLSLPIENGMGGVLVSGAEDVIEFIRTII